MILRKPILVLVGVLFLGLIARAQPQLTRIEYFIDTDPGRGLATPFPFTPSTDVNISQVLDLSPLSEGFHWLMIRAKDSDGRWSHLTNRLFYKGIVTPPIGTEENIIRVEYFFDSDPGAGLANEISIVPGTTVNITELFDLTALSDGLHWLNLRAMNADGKWSHITNRFFFKGIVTPPVGVEKNITRVEYFFDSEPGVGLANEISIVPGTSVSITELFDLSALSDGFHWLNIRARNADGKWSHITNRLFHKGVVTPPAPAETDIIKVEYFIDTDPGFGLAVPITITPGKTVNINQVFDLSTFSDGFHWINIRAMNADKKWSHLTNRLFFKGVVVTDNPTMQNITRVEYFIDSDPGLGKATPFTTTPQINVPVSEVIDVTNLADGFHWFYTRSQDASGRWSHASGRLFLKGYKIETPPVTNIKRVEYFLDTDPGIGKAIPFSFNESPDLTIEKNIDVSTIVAGKHTFAVRVQDSDGRWSFLKTRSFTTDITSPLPPQNLQVVPGDRRATLKWRKNTEPDFLKYKIFVGNTSGGGILVDSTSGGIADTTITLTELTNNVTFYFTVTAVDSARLESTPSNEVTGRPEPPVGLPAYPVAKPASGVLQNSFIANWSFCSTATGYRLDVSTNSLFTTIIPAYNNRDVLNVKSFQVTGLTLNTTYYYRVRAYNNDGTNTTSSNVITLKTLLNPPPPPNPPVVLSATLPGPNGFTANWRQSESATGYKIDISENNAFISYVPGYEKKDVSFSTTFSVTGLLPDRVYYFRVFATNGFGTSIPSNIGSIRTTSSSANVPIPPSAIAATNPTKASFTANWGSSPGATGYYVDVATNAAFTSLVAGFNKYDAGLVTNVTVTGLNPNTNYYYRIYAYNADGPSTPSGTILVKTLLNIPNAPTVLTVSSCDDLVTLKWRKNRETDISRYKIYGGTTINPVVEIATTTGGASDTSKILSGLTRGQVYYFRVAAENLEGNTSEYSNTSSVSVYKGVVPVVTVKWGDVLICSNVGDSIDSYQWYRNGNIIAGATGQYFVSNKSPGNYAVQTIDERGCVNMSASKSIGGAKSINFYPNPANSLLSVETENLEEGKALIRLYNALGIRVLEKQIVLTEDKEVNDISVSNLQPGVYYIEIIIRDERASYSKIVVTK